MDKRIKGLQIAKKSIISRILRRVWYKINTLRKEK